MGGALLPAWRGLMVRVRLVASDGHAGGAIGVAGWLMSRSSTVSLS